MRDVERQETVETGWDEVVSGRNAPTAPLTGAYRPIRAVSPPETPIAGTLATSRDGQVLLVDADELTGWPGWSLSGHHVAAPLDVARRQDGHDAVLPWCSHRIDESWAAGESLSGGEAVTLAVSLLRGTVEARQGLRGTMPGPDGEWWADRHGRPVFVPVVPGDESGGQAEARAIAVLDSVAQWLPDRVVRRLLDGAIDALREPARLAGEIGRLEPELFEACAPQPLRLEAEGSGGETNAARPVWRADESRTGGVIAETGQEALPERRRLRIEPLVELVGNGRIMEAVSDTVHRLRTTVGHAFRGRRAPLAIGVVAATAVIAVGLMWPSGDPEAVAETTRPVAAPEDPTDTPGEPSVAQEKTGRREPAGEPDEVSSGKSMDEAESSAPDHTTDDPVAAAAGVLAVAGECAADGDTTCSVVESGSAVLSDDEIPWEGLLTAELSSADDYGDVALVRAKGPDGADAVHYLVLARREGGWLLREVHAAA